MLRPTREGQKLVICCALWGDWHLRVFKEKALPTIIHESNLPAMEKMLEVEWLFFTQKPRDPRLDFDFGSKTEVISIHLQYGYKSAWRYAKYEAAKRDALIMFLAPDIVWSRGSFKYLADLILEGKKLIYMSHPRGIEDVWDGGIRSGQEMMLLCRDKPHPVNTSLQVDVRPFTNHPEMILWPMEGGWLCRMLAREPLICTSETTFNERNLVNSPFDSGELAVVESSDDACGVSLAPESTEAHHYRAGNLFRPEGLLPFLDKHPSSTGRAVAFRPVLWRYSEVDSRQWKVTREHSQQIIQQAFR